MLRFFSKRKHRKDALPHFLRDYEALVDRLIKTKPLDEAMSAAVGGNYDEIGAREAAIVSWAGLREGMAILDFGCGSGRLAHALSKTFTSLDYTGIDVVQRLLDYAKSKSPAHYRFIQSHAFRLPLADQSVDLVACFSVFTHLLPAESYVYLGEMQRVLKPGGRLVMSFLEFAQPGHWPMFLANVENINGTFDHLNTLLERSVLDLWCERLDLRRIEFVEGNDSRWASKGTPQSLVLIEKKPL